MYAIGASVAYFILVFLAARHTPNISRRFLAALFAACYVSGYFGARLYSLVIEDFSVTTLGDVLVGLTQFGSMTFYGGALTSFAIGLALVLWRSKPVPDLFDLSLPAALMALAIGRVGCFLNGDDFGIPVELANGQTAPWWAVIFPNLNDGIARVPVQLISAIASGILASALIGFFGPIRHTLGRGAVGYLAVIFYSVGRFFIEYIRADFRGTFLWGLSPAQITSILVLTIVTVTLPKWWVQWRR